MRVIIHGATNGSNFGDFLFADIFYKKISSINKNGKTLFFEFPKYGIGDFFRKNMRYNKKMKIGDLIKADLLVYMSGGYFGERTPSIKESLIRFVRYMPIGILFKIKRKPILIIGVGGGPISNKYLRKIMCSIMNYAKVITVRDEVTANYFKKYGVSNKLIVTSDTAQIIKPEMLPQLDSDVKKDIKELFKGKKIIFLHAIASKDGGEFFAEKVIRPLNNFLLKHKEYGVIIGFDQKSSKSIKDLTLKKKLQCDTVYCYDYKNPWQLVSLLNEVNMIITPKLHVGIVGATLSKSVLSFPIHSEKTKRYYSQIGVPERSVSLKQLTDKMAEDMLEKYHDKNIILPQTVIQAASKNLEILEEEIRNLLENRRLR